MKKLEWPASVQNDLEQFLDKITLLSRSTFPYPSPVYVWTHGDSCVRNWEYNLKIVHPLPSYVCIPDLAYVSIDGTDTKDKLILKITPWSDYCNYLRNAY